MAKYDWQRCEEIGRRTKTTVRLPGSLRGPRSLEWPPDDLRFPPDPADAFRVSLRAIPIAARHCTRSQIASPAAASTVHAGDGRECRESRSFVEGVGFFFVRPRSERQTKCFSRNHHCGVIGAYEHLTAQRDDAKSQSSGWVRLYDLTSDKLFVRCVVIPPVLKR